jgi:rubredoxin
MTANRCPGCGYIYDEANGAPREKVDFEPS